MFDTGPVPIIWRRQDVRYRPCVDYLASPGCSVQTLCRFFGIVRRSGDQEATLRPGGGRRLRGDGGADLGFAPRVRELTGGEGAGVDVEIVGSVTFDETPEGALRTPDPISPTCPQPAQSVGSGGKLLQPATRDYQASGTELLALKTASRGWSRRSGCA